MSKRVNNKKGGLRKRSSYNHPTKVRGGSGYYEGTRAAQQRIAATQTFALPQIANVVSVKKRTGTDDPA